MDWQIGIDTGGTFTDLVAINRRDGRMLFKKVHSTPEDPGAAFCAGLAELCASHGIERIHVLIHGSTVATNALLERKGARTAFVTTAGFRDVLLIQRQNRPRLYDLRGRRPVAVVPRRLIFEADERILGNGQIEIALDPGSLEAIVASLQAEGIESVAIGFLNSYINPVHELGAREFIRRRLPGLEVSLSHQVVRSEGEYERFSTCTINSYVQPKMQGYLSRLRERLHAHGVRSHVFIMKSNGGMTSAEVAGERSAETLLSGPAGGVMAGTRLAAESRHKNLITADVGGTSFDVSVIHDGQPSYASQSEVDGLALRVPIVDIHTVGAGGGSIAWIDAGSALRVGPRSAGAIPGPVCYKNGGTEPTVTDANLVLGRISSQSSLGGAMELDVAAAREAIAARLASRLNLDVMETAEGIIRIVNARMTAAIRKLTIERGYDPSGFSLCIFGGAGPLHGAELAEEIGVGEVIVPLLPGVFSAYGLLLSEMREEQICTWTASLADTDLARMDACFSALAAEAMGRLGAARGAAAGHRTFRRVQMRYQGQSHVIPIELPAGPLDKETLAHLFRAAHKRLYGYAFADEPVEIVNLWAIVTLEAATTPLPPYRPASAPMILGARPVFLEGKWQPATLYNRLSLPIGTQLEGPALVEQPDTTTLILPHQQATVDEHGNLVLHSRRRRRQLPIISSRRQEASAEPSYSITCS